MSSIRARVSEMQEKNHFAKVCRSSHAHAHEIISDTDSAASIEHIDVTSEVSLVQGKRKIFASMLVIGSGKTVNFHVNTGSSVNIIPASVLSADAEITPTTTILKSWSGNLIKPVGECRVLIRNHRTGKNYRVRFQVVKEDLTPIIGLTASQSMQLITIHELNMEQPADRVHSASTQSAEDITAAYPDVFGDGIGTLPGEQHLRTDPSVSPHINPMRRVPHSVVEPLKEELKAMEAKGVIKRVQEPTAWESSLVVTRKSNGNLRVCIDPKHLNVALERERYPMKTIEDILPKLQKCKVFSVVDLKSGYWHVQLDDESSRLTTFKSPNGRYCWLRLPFGLKVSAEIFQRRLDAVLEDLDGVLNVADDVFVLGRGDTYEEAVADHDRNLIKLLERCRRHGIKLNQEKLQLRLTILRFLGHLVAEDDLRPDPDKVRAVQETPPPQDVAELRRYVGFLQYLAKFLPRLSDVAAPLHDLTRKDTLGSGSKPNKMRLRLPGRWRPRHWCCDTATPRQTWKSNAMPAIADCVPHSCRMDNLSRTLAGR